MPGSGLQRQLGARFSPRGLSNLPLFACRRSTVCTVGSLCGVYPVERGLDWSFESRVKSSIQYVRPGLDCYANGATVRATVARK